jgi:hypothetical protein
MNKKWETNRTQKLSPKKGFGWCKYCDQALVASGAKCKVCGRLNGKRRLKKSG